MVTWEVWAWVQPPVWPGWDLRSFEVQARTIEGAITEAQKQIRPNNYRIVQAQRIHPPWKENL